MDTLVRLRGDRQGGQRRRLGVTFAGSLAPRAALDVFGDVEFEGRPPPESGDPFLCSLNGAVSGQAMDSRHRGA